MAPEQLYAAHEVDHRADLYSLGVLLFEMLSGARPSDGDNAEAIIAAMVAGNGKKLAAVDPLLPPALVSVVERALSPDRDQRFASAYEMRVELARSSGELSPAGLAAARSAPLPALASDTRHDAAPAASGSGHVPDTVDARKAPGVPATLPPEDGGGRRATGTQAAAPNDGGRRATGTQAAAPPTAAQAPWGGSAPGAPVARPRKRRTWPWLLGVVLVIGLGVGAVFAVQALLPTRRVIPELPPFEPPATATDTGAVQIGPTETAQPGVPGTPTPTTPQVQNPAGQGTKPRAVPSGSPPASGGAPGLLPLPFPSIALPSSLPPLPSGFPTTLPPGFPTTLPSFLPQIPGLTLPAAPTPAPATGGTGN
jgi:hypothetical protein